MRFTNKNYDQNIIKTYLEAPGRSREDPGIIVRRFGESSLSGFSLAWSTARSALHIYVLFFLGCFLAFSFFVIFFSACLIFFRLFIVVPDTLS